jgi:hypothetical protein
MNATAPSFAHLASLTDATGLYEHARFATPRAEHGYCTDDAARGLVVTSREPRPSPTVRRLASRYLDFLADAQDRTGAFRNRLGPDRQWRDDYGVSDWWGRALWGLGTAAGTPSSHVREPAMAAFTLGCQRRSPYPRAMAFAGLGAAEVLRAEPGHAAAAALLSDAAAAIGRPTEDPTWWWPQPRLTYANAALAEVLIAAGQLAPDNATLSAGLAMLEWLCDVQLADGHLSVVAVAGWQRDGPRARYDQQPIEVAAIADACTTAALATGDPSWERWTRYAAAWFHGDNDAGTAMWSPATGGGFDGLTRHGPNLNQGAESTLALISTLQRARELGALAASRPARLLGVNDV